MQAFAAGIPIAAAAHGPALTRMDMHVHSRASSGPAMKALGLIGAPECYSPPERVYEQARARGMDLVTITDHDTIAGAMELHERGFGGFVIGEEVTVHFPEDRCRLHVLVWGLTPEHHEQIGRFGLRDDVYAFADWLADHNLAHSVAHPLYIQNGRLRTAHVEKCVLLFKCFETLNGAHSGLHRGTLERYLTGLTPAVVQKLADRHRIGPLWPRVWDKGQTGGSDDHGLLNVGRTWTGVASDDGAKVGDPRLFLRRVMSCKSEPGGDAGHVSLLAHQLATVAAHYAAAHVVPRLRPRARYAAAELLKFAGVRVRRPGLPALAWDTVRSRVRRWRRGRSSAMSHVLGDLRKTLPGALDRFPGIAACLDPSVWVGGAALSRHDEMPRLVDELVERLMRSALPRAVGAWRGGDRAGVRDGALGLGMLAAAQIPYIVSLFQQNKERPFLARFERETRMHMRPGDTSDHSPARPLRVALFTDTLGDVNGVSRFIQNVAQQARERGRELRVFTSTRFKTPDAPNIRNFEPLFAAKMPRYENLEFAIPPVVRMLRELDGEPPDVIHVSTPGPVGMVGWIAARMLHAPVLGVYHTDFPAYVDHLFDDHAFTWITARFMRFFYKPFTSIFTRSVDYTESLVKLGMARERILPLKPGIDTDTFHVRHREERVWDRVLGTGVAPGVKVLYVGRVSVEKTLPLLSKVWRRVHARCAAAGLAADLIVVGDGPYRATMAQELAGARAHFLGFRHGQELSAIYASADMFVFPSTTDTLGQVVMEAQSSGLPVIVSDQGGPKEVVGHGRTGYVLSADDPDAWAEAIVGLAADPERRRRMGRAAHEAIAPMSIARSFDHFWESHEQAWRERVDGTAPPANSAHDRKPVVST